MDVKQQEVIQKRTVYPCHPGLPFCFTAEVLEQGAALSFNVSAHDENGNVVKSDRYQLNSTEHASYLDMFQKLHVDFGFRLPQNRRPYVKPSFTANYRELLLDNLDKGMRYGYGDPAIIRVGEDGSHYYLVSTSNDAPNSFPIIRSENLTEWKFVGYVFPKGHKPLWAADGELVSDYWAPEMHKVGNEYRIYFVARDKETRELCIGLARSASPEGPFMPEPQPVLKGNVIDPHIFIHDEETTYLFWKEDNNDRWPMELINLLWDDTTLVETLFTEKEDSALACFIITLRPWLLTLAPMERFLFTQVFIEAVTSRFTSVYNLLNDLAARSTAKAEQTTRLTAVMKTPVYARQLTPDGHSFIGDKVKVLENDLDWEAHLVEGMWVTKHANKYYLFYAGNDFSTDQYGIGAAIADSPLGPYHKLKAPILSSTEKWLAPGHPSVTTAPNGEPVMLLHAYFPGKAGYKQFRALLAIPLHLSGDSVSAG